MREAERLSELSVQGLMGELIGAKRCEPWVGSSDSRNGSMPGEKQNRAT
jgi:hypothetical protein